MSPDQGAAAPPPAEIRPHYELVDEGRRLLRPGNRIELLRVRELMRHFLPSAPGLVIDVGGATGIYALWLAELAYEVHLLDPFTDHVAAARGRVPVWRARRPATLALYHTRMRRPMRHCSSSRSIT